MGKLFNSMQLICSCVQDSSGASFFKACTWYIAWSLGWNVTRDLLGFARQQHRNGRLPRSDRAAEGDSASAQKVLMWAYGVVDVHRISSFLLMSTPYVSQDIWTVIEGFDQHVSEYGYGIQVDAAFRNSDGWCTELSSDCDNQVSLQQCELRKLPRRILQLAVENVTTLLCGIHHKRQAVMVKLMQAQNQCGSAKRWMVRLNGSNTRTCN